MATAQALLKKFINVKTLPHVAIRLSKLISDESSTMQEFENLIKMDPTLVLRVLRTVNSSYYGLRQRVDSIARAVIVIGMKNLRNMVVTEALKDIFRQSSDEDIFSRRLLWLHCAAVGICSQMISERIFTQKGEDAFLCGILHDIGMIVEDQVEQDLFFQACKVYEPATKPITDYEREVIGTDHCAIGYLLARDWKLPVEVQEGIKQHHKALEQVSPSSITGIIQIAEYFVSKLNYTAIPGMNAMLSPPLIAHIRDNLEEYKVLIQDFPDEMSKAKDLYESQEE
jgi:putative nucleotidyltransferase with HDIG domain